MSGVSTGRGTFQTGEIIVNSEFESKQGDTENPGRVTAEEFVGNVFPTDIIFGLGFISTHAVPISSNTTLASESETYVVNGTVGETIELTLPGLSTNSKGVGITIYNATAGAVIEITQDGSDLFWFDNASISLLELDDESTGGEYVQIKQTEDTTDYWEVIGKLGERWFEGGG